MRPHLSSFEHAWTDAAFDAIYPEPALQPEHGPARGPLPLALPHGVKSMHPARFFDGLLASIPFEQWLGLRVTLWIVAFAPLFTIGRLGTIASIAPEDRVRVIARLVTSRIYVIRQLAMSFKAVATLLYSQSDAVRSAMTTPVRRAVPAVPLGARSEGLVSATRLTSRGKATVEGGSHEHAA